MVFLILLPVQVIVVVNFMYLPPPASDGGRSSIAVIDLSRECTYELGSKLYSMNANANTNHDEKSVVAAKKKDQ